LPLCEYKEIWQFYEDRKNQYDERDEDESVASEVGEAVGEL
jgi:hypothetical protein